MSKIKSKKTIEKEMNDIWSLKVRERDNFTCQICGKKIEKQHAHAHHIIPRQFRGLRWEINNGITLCFVHHKVGMYSPHQNAIWFFGWMNEHKPIQLKFCIDKLKEVSRKNESSINTTE